MTMVETEDGRTVHVSELGGLAEVAAAHGWDPSTMTTWANRYSSCPTPVVRLRRGALYVVSDWDGWEPPSREAQSVSA